MSLAILDPKPATRAETASGGRGSEITRPTTARAAPPRVARKREADEAAALLAAEQESQRLLSAKPRVQVITEGSSGGDGDAQFQVEDSMHVAVDGDDREMRWTRGASDAVDVDAKGSLMKQLVETKQALEGDEGPREDSATTERHEEQDVATLRARLQGLSRSANPLARVLDALQEDLDSMLTELGTWADEFSRNSALLHSERHAIDAEVDALMTRLQVVDQEIAAQTDKIAAAKAAIHDHEATLTRVIALVVEKS